VIAIHPAYQSTETRCRCRELDVTCACNKGFENDTTGSTSNVIHIVFTSDSTASTIRLPRGWRTPKFRPHRNCYAAPERFEPQPLPVRVDLRVWLHRKPTRRATAKAVRNWRSADALR
jgi:hypothetical protein